MDINHLLNIHLGEILRLEFLGPLKITPYRLSKDMNVAQFWLNLQTQYDLRLAQEENKEIYSHIPLAQLPHSA